MHNDLNGNAFEIMHYIMYGTIPIARLNRHLLSLIDVLSKN